MCNIYIYGNPPEIYLEASYIMFFKTRLRKHQSKTRKEQYMIDTWGRHLREYTGMIYTSIYMEHI